MNQIKIITDGNPEDYTYHYETPEDIREQFLYDMFRILSFGEKITDIIIGETSLREDTALNCKSKKEFEETFKEAIFLELDRIGYFITPAVR